MVSFRVLATGFGPFLKHTQNPSMAVARGMERCSSDDLLWEALVPLPVRYQQAAEHAKRRLHSTSFDAIVAFGLASKAGQVRLERYAVNRACSPKPDNAGVIRAGFLAEPGAPVRRETPLALTPLLSAFRRHKIACQVSHDAGGYVCNDLYFRLLGLELPVLFVHIPPSPHPQTCPAFHEGFAGSLAYALGSERIEPRRLD